MKFGLARKCKPERRTAGEARFVRQKRSGRQSDVGLAPWPDGKLAVELKAGLRTECQIREGFLVGGKLGKCAPAGHDERSPTPREFRERRLKFGRHTGAIGKHQTIEGRETIRLRPRVCV